MNDRPSFELKGFNWAAPDRLDVSGVFDGLGARSTGDPTLVVNGAGGAHRLPAVAGSVSGPPTDSAPWEAAFAWQEVPVAFEEASLEFEGGVRVELPQPGPRRTLLRHRIEVQLPGEEAPIDLTPTDAPAEPEAEPEAAKALEPAPTTAEGLRIQAEAIAAEEKAREAETAARQARAELARVSEDLAEEREGRSADAERFHQVLERYRSSAEAAVAAAQDAAARLGSELREANEALEAEQAARNAMESELEPLRLRVATLERSATEADGIRAQLEEAREQAQTAAAEAAGLHSALEAAEGETQAVRAELATARGALDDARADAQRLLEHLVPGNETSGDG
jgi:hypothetical protein